MKIIDYIKNIFNKEPQFEEFPLDSKWMFDEELKPLWKKIQKCKEFYALKTTKQSPKWHREGNAWEHTKLVTEYMRDYVLSKFDLTNLMEFEEARLLMTSALFHDIGKPSTTFFDDTDSDWHCKNHGEVGEKMTRQLLEDEPIWFREKVCWLVRNHMVFHYFMEKSDAERLKIINKLAKGLVSIEYLTALHISDCSGSISPENKPEELSRKVGIIKAIAHSRYDKCPEFLNTIPNLKGPKAYIMIGLAGSGKDTFIKKHLSNIECICRDDFRELLTYKEIKGQKLYLDKNGENKVTQMVNDAIEDACLNHRDIVINQTSLVKKYRKALVDKIKEYDPNYNIIYIYVEPMSGVVICKMRRKGEIKPDIIQGMWDRLEFPDFNECENIIIIET